MEINREIASYFKEEDDDHQRQGTLLTGTSHVVTAVIGSGVLALPWSVAQLGWIAGPIMLAAFSFVTFYTSTLLADCYRNPRPTMGKRNRTYIAAVRSYLGPKEVLMCGIAQYVNLWGTLVGYSITATVSMVALQRSSCLHRRGGGGSCEGGAYGKLFMVIFGLVELVLSQFPSLEKITWMSVVAAVMSFAYSTIGLFMCIAKWVAHGQLRGNLAGAEAGSPANKTWMVLQAVGNIAFAFTYAEVLIEIQDTLRSPPDESKTMKKVAAYGIGLTTIFYLSLGSIGYAAFGSEAPGNLLTDTSGLVELFWIVDIANICIVVHLVGAYQVFAQPIFAGLEKKMGEKWPNSSFIHSIYEVPVPVPLAGGGQGKSRRIRFSMSKLVLRSLIIVVTTLVALLLPFFNAVLGLLGALSFWPLTVLFPVIMHIAQREIPRWSNKWLMLQALNLACLLLSLLVTIGSVADIVNSLKVASPFKSSF